jgi:hypothetical protein
MKCSFRSDPRRDRTGHPVYRPSIGIASVRARSDARGTRDALDRPANSCGELGYASPIPR